MMSLDKIIEIQERFEKMEIKGYVMKKGGVYYFNPSEDSIDEAKRKFKIFF